MNELIKSALPWIGTALVGPLGGIAATAVGRALGLDDKSVEKVKEVLSGMTPEQVEKLKETELQVQVQLAQMGYDSLAKLEELNVRVLESVNKTMQTEAVAEHWPTYSWRPAIGFAVAFNLISASIVIFIAYIFKPDLVPQIPGMLAAQAGLNAVAMPVLGIASYFRGKAQADPNIPPAIQIPFKATN